MFIFDISQPITLILLLVATVLIIFLSQQVKKSLIAGSALIVYLALIVFHVSQLTTLAEEYRYLSETLSRCVVIDAIFIFVTFFSYLWVDDLEAKANNKKSLDNSLDWFWKKI